MGSSCVAMASVRNACLVAVCVFVFIALHTSIALYGFKGVDLSPHHCLHHYPNPNSTKTSTKPTNKPHSTPEPPRKNLFYSTGPKKIDLWISAAILDFRANQTRVHIVGAERRNAVKGEFFCRWRYNEEEDHEDGIHMDVKAEHTLVDAHWPHWGPIFACHFVCRLPNNTTLKTISLVSKDGSVKIEDIPVDRGQELTPRESLAVCIKPANGPLSVSKLVEWFEQLRAAGIAHVIMYHTDVHGNGRYVLEYYQKLGLLTLVSYPFLFATLERVDTLEASLSGQDRYAVYQQIYLTALQECLNRFRSSYEHILLMDIDEILLPMKNESLQTTIKRMKSKRENIAGFLFLTSWHFEEFGAKKNDSSIQELYMQKYPESTEPIDNQPKCIVNTDLAETVNFHGVTSTLHDKYQTNALVPWQEFGYLHHFRGRCDGKFEKKRCDEELLPKHRPDHVLLRYRDEVVSRVSKVMETLQLH